MKANILLGILLGSVCCILPSALKAEEGHQHTFHEVILSEPTCQAPGIKAYQCECGEKTNRSQVVLRKLSEHAFEIDMSRGETGILKCKWCDATIENSESVEHD